MASTNNIMGHLNQIGFVHNAEVYNHAEGDIRQYDSSTKVHHTHEWPGPANPPQRGASSSSSASVTPPADTVQGRWTQASRGSPFPGSRAASTGLGVQSPPRINWSYPAPSNTPAERRTPSLKPERLNGLYGTPTPVLPTANGASLPLGLRHLTTTNDGDILLYRILTRTRTRTTRGNTRSTVNATTAGLEATWLVLHTALSYRSSQFHCRSRLPCPCVSRLATACFMHIYLAPTSPR
ncbi:hypothetical protein C8R47DRAFT_184041 [Mycena vitilis]|nr:hypothetical protein C8R47DRAFT_184041 [Mycena vitilis]